MYDLSDTLKEIQNNFIQCIDSQEAQFQNFIDIIQNKTKIVTGKSIQVSDSCKNYNY